MDIGTSDGGSVMAFAARFDAMASGEHKPGLHDALGGACTDLVKLGFQDGKAPSGDPWTPTVAGNSPPLTGPTQELRNSPRWEVTSDGFTLLVTDWKAVFHNNGSRSKDRNRLHVPARRMLPVDTLPPLWIEIMQEETSTYLHKFILG